MRAALPLLIVLAACWSPGPNDASLDGMSGPTRVAGIDGEDGDEAGDHEHKIAGIPTGMWHRAQGRLAGGPVPHDALVQASQRQEQLLATDSGASVQWNWLGPANAGGRIRAVVVHPTNGQRLWIGSAGGGVWRSDDGGATWQPKNSLLAILSIGCMALDPADSNHLYAGTGEGFFAAPEGSSNSAFLRGAGIFETFDAGETWSRIASTGVPNFYFTNRIAISPANANIMLAATNTGIFRTIDRGQTWTQVHNQRTLDVDFHPTDGARAVAGGATGTALLSTNGGVGWTAATLPTTATRIELAYARSSPTQVYAAVTNATGDAITIWLSADGGQTYALRTVGAGHPTLSVYLSSLWVDPTNALNLVFGGQQAWRSTDGGITRTQIQTGAYFDYHAIVEAAGFNGTTNKRIYTGCDGGLYTRADWQAGSWSSLNQGLGITQFYGAAVNPTSGVIVAGAQDNQTARYGGSVNWTTRLIGGDGVYCSADQTDPNTFYAGFYYFGLQRSSNAGLNWTSIRGVLPNSPAESNFIPWTMLDPNNQGRMLACGRALWRSNDVKTGNPPTWTQIKAPRTCAAIAGTPPNDHFEVNLSCNLSMAAIATGNSDLIWAAHNDGEVHKTSNGTAASPVWTLVDGVGGALPDRWVSSIVIDPADHQRVYLTFLGYTANNVYRTTDGGATWLPIAGVGAGALPAVPCTWLAQHPRVRSWLFVGTDIGLWSSPDDGASWAPVAGGPVNVPIEQLVWKYDRSLLCVTHGQGIYEAVLPTALVQPGGAGCAAGAPPLLASTPPVLGATLTESIAGAQPNGFVFFAYAFGAPVPQPFGSCTVHVDLQTAVVEAAGTTSGTGSWTLPIPLPGVTALIGSQVTVQAFVGVPGGPMLGLGDLTNALALSLGF